MIDRSEAERIALEFSRDLMTQYDREEIVLNDEAAIEKPYGWLFVFTTAAFLRTRDWEDALLGAGPLLVLREDGQVVVLPTFYSEEDALRAYEEGRLNKGFEQTE
ncbi:YrhB domain-containing protein [Nonomuraea sp. NPDC051191]|uniref:YrhB domain-containing protein n=1 Tax=Nonomuraea sp. NPDC051191 TaxID=3364372 RepID=UPI0037985295